MNKRNQLFTLLNEEINNINYEHSKSGWTIWALLAALSTVIWVTLNQIEILKPDWKNVQITLVIISFGVHVVISTNGLLNSKSSNSKNFRYRTGSELFSKKSKTAVLRVLWCLLILYFVYNQQSLISHLTYILSVIILFQNIIASIVIWSMPMQKNVILFQDANSGLITKTKINWLIYLIISSLLIISIYCLCKWLQVLNLYTTNLISDTKISILLFAVYFITTLIYSQFYNSKLLENLSDIRRDLVLTNKTDEEITDELDAAVRGHKIEKFTDTEFSQVLKSLENFHSEISNAKLKIVFQNNSTISGRKISDEEHYAIFENLAFAGRIQFTHVEPILRQLKFKEKYVSLFSKHSTIQSQIDELNSKNEKYKNEFIETVKEYFNFLSENRGKEFASKMIVMLNSFIAKQFFSIDSGKVKP